MAQTIKSKAKAAEAARPKATPLGDVTGRVAQLAIDLEKAKTADDLRTIHAELRTAEHELRSLVKLFEVAEAEADKAGA